MMGMNTQFTSTERKQVAELVISRLRMEVILPHSANGNVKRLEHLKDAILTLQVFGGDDWELAIGLVGEYVRQLNGWITNGAFFGKEAEKITVARDVYRALLLKLVGEVR